MIGKIKILFKNSSNQSYFFYLVLDRVLTQNNFTFLYSICASDYEMKRKWSSAWNTGFIGTIGLRKSTGGPAPKKD